MHHDDLLMIPERQRDMYAKRARAAGALPMPLVIELFPSDCFEEKRD